MAGSSPAMPTEREFESIASDNKLFFDGEALDPADKERAVVVQSLGLGRGVGAGHRLTVVEPGLGDPIDLDRGLRDVGPGARLLDAVLHIAAHAGHGMR